MNKLLFISYFFPPLGGPGVQRSLKFVKYLPDHGWQPLVLSVKKIEYLAEDLSLMNEIPDTMIFRSGSFDPMRLLHFIQKFQRKRNRIYHSVSQKKKQLFRNIYPIDSKIGWIPFAIKKGVNIIKQHDIKAVYATIGPFSSAIVAFKLAQKFQLPLILDYRDLWNGKPDLVYFSKWHKRISVKWEKKVLTHTDRIIVCTKTFALQLREMYPFLSPAKFKVIFNGWDSDEFQEIKKRENTLSKLIFSYTGGFYGGQTPLYFLRALEELETENRLPNNLEIRFIGNFFPEILEMFNNSSIEKYCRIISQVSHRACLQLQADSDVLLLFIGKKNSEGILTQKLFEYLAVQRPILAMIPENGEAADILQENSSALISEIDDVQKIKRNLLFFFDKSNRMDFSRKMKTDHWNYERKFLTGKLAEVLNELNEKK